jgi:hypothetical protein
MVGRCKISAEAAAGDPEGFAVPLAWGEFERLPVRAANQLAVQIDALGTSPDMVVLSIGHASPPIVTGTEEQQIERWRQIKEVPVQPVARVSVSIGRLKEWAALLHQTVAKLEERERGEAQP